MLTHLEFYKHLYLAKGFKCILVENCIISLINEYSALLSFKGPFNHYNC